MQGLAKKWQEPEIFDKLALSALFQFPS
uniref:Uncharacterized protein n=1 Tax=Arundo donax TaxID=35708 RepID=A0A0A9B479_ARUDO